jgi:hypothetical protein
MNINNKKNKSEMATTHSEALFSSVIKKLNFLPLILHFFSRSHLDGQPHFRMSGDHFVELATRVLTRMLWLYSLRP